MGKVVVQCNNLSEYGNVFETKSDEFSQITKSMENIVSELESGWNGIDADNFKSNAIAYLNNLKRLESTMLYLGNFIKEKSANYNNACANFYNILNG